MSTSTTPAATAVRIRGLRRVFGARPVLDGLELTLARGEFLALLGASGSGKTTLLRILGALDGADGGEALVPEARTIVFQEPRLIPSKKVLANVTVGLPRGAATRATGLRALAEVGLERHADAWPATLSGGEAQRVALARALVRGPNSCSSTSRSPHWTRSPGSGCRTWSASSAGSTARPCCS